MAMCHGSCCAHGVGPFFIMEGFVAIQVAADAQLALRVLGQDKVWHWPGSETCR